MTHTAAALLRSGPLTATNRAEARAPKSSPCVNRVIMSNAVLGWSMGTYVVAQTGTCLLQRSMQTDCGANNSQSYANRLPAVTYELSFLLHVWTP